ncbi:MAG: hypothetical protein U0Z44_09235 [Kouleothrix sp.]
MPSRSASARRFATYKRHAAVQGSRAPEGHPEPTDRPVQIVFAGKAHLADDPGKLFIQQVYQMSQQPGFLARSCSSRSTTCAWPASSCRAWMYG